MLAVIRCEDTRGFRGLLVTRWMHRQTWIAVFLMLFSAHSHSLELDDAATNHALKDNVSIAVHEAPAAVFFAALFANTPLEVTVDSDVTQSISGNFSGSILDVLTTVSNSLSLTHSVHERRIRVKTSDFSAPVQTTIAARQRRDPVVERLFLLQHARASDQSLDWATDVVIPGVASRLNGLAKAMNLEAHTWTNIDSKLDNNVAMTFTPLPSMNAVVVRDRESRMPLYQDLIESLDSPIAVNTTKTIPSSIPTPLSKIDTAPNVAAAINWQVVR